MLTEYSQESCLLLYRSEVDAVDDLRGRQADAVHQLEATCRLASPQAHSATHICCSQNHMIGQVVTPTDDWKGKT